VKNYWMRIAALLFAFALIAAACGGGDDDATESGESSAATDPPETDEAMEEEEGAMEEEEEAMEEAAGVDLAGAELQLWGWASSAAEDTQLTSLVAQFNSDTGADATFEPQPEYDVALQASLAAGDPPDVFYVDSGKLPDLVDSGALAPVPDGVLSDPDDIYSSLRDVFTIDGTWYCPPKDFSTLGLVYDPVALTEAGLEVPTTWEELATVAAALTTADRVGLSFGAEYARAGSFLFQAGTDILTADGTAVAIDSDGARQALQYLADLYAAGSVASPGDIDTGWGGEAFGSGAAAMTIEGNWIVGFLGNEFPDRDFAVAELPQGPQGQGNFAFTVCYGVASNAENPEQSWALVEYLTSAEGAAAWTSGFQVMPARESAAAGWLADNPELSAFVDGAAYASRFQFPSGVGDIQGVFDDAYQRLIAGDITVDELIKEVVDAGDDLL